jgi:hypothetical protein
MQRPTSEFYFYYGLEERLYLFQTGVNGSSGEIAITNGAMRN